MECFCNVYFTNLNQILFKWIKFILQVDGLLSDLSDPHNQDMIPGPSSSVDDRLSGYEAIKQELFSDDSLSDNGKNLILFIFHITSRFVPSAVTPHRLT